MKSLIPIILVVLAVTFSTVSAANSAAQSNRTASAKKSESKNFCESDSECREKVHHEAYCVEEQCVCPVGTTFVVKHDEPRCEPWFCEQDEDCKLAEGDLKTHEKCLHDICGCPEGWHAHKWRCTEDEKDKKKKK